PSNDLLHLRHCRFSSPVVKRPTLEHITQMSDQIVASSSDDGYRVVSASTPQSNRGGIQLLSQSCQRHIRLVETFDRSQRNAHRPSAPGTVEQTRLNCPSHYGAIQAGSHSSFRHGARSAMNEYSLLSEESVNLLF